MSSVPVAGIVLFPLLGGMIAPLAGLWRRRAAGAVALLAAVGSAACALRSLLEALRTGPVVHHLGGWMPPFGIEWVVDPLSGGMALLIGIIATAVFVYSGPSLDAELPARKVPFYACALLLVAGLQGMVVTGDLFNVYVFLEVASLSAYALVACGERQAPVAALRYLIIGSLGASLYLLGIGHLYAATGSLNMADVAKRVAAADPATVRLSLSLIFAGLAIKMGLFPLHGWVPDAYTHAPSVSSALMSGLVTKVAAYVMLRVGFWVYGLGVFSQGYTSTLAWAGAAAILAGGMLAYAQTDLKRMLAYSSIGHVGYIALGIGLANRWALVGAALHVVFHSVMKSGLFLVLGSFSKEHGVRRVHGLAKLRGRMPWTVAAFVAGGLSMTGIPPFCGFFSKWYIIMGAMQADRWFFVAVIAASTLLSAAYFFRAVQEIGFHPASDPAPRASEGPAAMLLPILALAGSLVVLGLGSDWLRVHVVERALPGGLW